MDGAHCPACGSRNVYASRKHGCLVCEDCEHRYDEGAAPSTRSIFFSYGHDANDVIVHRLRTDLEARGHTVWIDSARIKTGDDWRRSITDGLLESSTVLGFLSQHSVRDPGVCLDELKIALAVKGSCLQTVLLESNEDVMPPATVSHIQWLDMSDWRQIHDRGGPAWDAWYQQRFDELCAVVESPDSAAFEGDISRLRTTLSPHLTDTKEQALVEAEFTPRPWLTERIEEWRTRADASRALVLLGGPGTGKSSFVARQLHYDHASLCGVFCEWDKASTTDAKSVTDQIAFKLATRLPDYRRLLLHQFERQLTPRRREEASASEYFEMLVTAPLGQAIQGDRERLLVFIDGLDEADVAHRNLLTEVLATNLHRLPSWLGMVLTSRPEPHIVQALGAHELLDLDAARAQVHDDIHSYLAATLRQELRQQDRRLEILDAIARNSMGSFLYATLFAAAVRSGSIPLDDPSSYPRGLDAFFWQDFRRRFPTSEDFVRSRSILEALAAVQTVPIDLLADALGLTPYDLHEFRRDFGSLVRRTTVAAGTGRPPLDAITFSHKAIADWLGDPARSGDFAVDSGRGLRSIAGQCLADVRHQKQPVTSPNTPTDAALEFRQRHVGDLLARATMWNELESFLMEPDTPLVPYWQDLARFPSFHPLNALDDRLWSSPDRDHFFTSMQRSGQRELLATILDRQVARFGIGHLDASAFDLHVDMVHLGGEYRRAVDLCDEYLATLAPAVIRRDPALVRLAIRRLHHSMFFAPVGPLIDRARELLDNPAISTMPQEHNELLFLIGGNLGTLSGDFELAEAWTRRSLDLAVSQHAHDFELRSVRKLAEILTATGRLEEAEAILTPHVTPGADLSSRYELYALAALGEVHRLRSRPDQARRCFEQVRDTARVLGIPGWQAHGSLGLANLLLTLDLPHDALPYATEALRQHTSIGQAWGEICAALVRCRIEAKMLHDDTRLHASLDELAQRADTLGYRYHHRVLAALQRGEAADLALQFL